MSTSASSEGRSIRSPGLLFLMSAAVPGAGQLYMGQKRGFGFLAVEVAAFAGWLHYDSEGEDKKQSYLDYVMAHYSRANYLKVLEQDIYVEAGYGIGNSDKDARFDNFFTLPELEGPHADPVELYEDVHKLDKYVMGWDDWYEGHGYDVDPSGTIDWTGWDPDSDFLPPGTSPLTAFDAESSEHRKIYRGMRQDANASFDDAKRFAWVLLVNHAVAAFDAYRSGKAARAAGSARAEAPRERRGAVASATSRILGGGEPKVDLLAVKGRPIAKGYLSWSF